MIIRVAVPGPFLTGLDYLLEANTIPGVRVVVPLGRRKVVGVVLEINCESEYPINKLRAVISVLDTEPVISYSIFKLAIWMSRYYQYPIGEAFYTVLPKKLCEVKEPKLKLQADKPAFISNNNNKLKLNSAQEVALNACLQDINTFSVKLLDGVTGSGKTEVYLQLIAEVLAAGKQVLILVPEIGLTPQTVSRFKERFNQTIAVLHSKITPKQRYENWMQALRGELKIIIGTRSAIFTPCKNLGLIIIDEEHDLSFKQQSSLRYSAKACAIYRAKLEKAMVLLGSATPALETLNYALVGQYQHLNLPKRAGAAVEPHYHVIDIRQKRLEAGLSTQMLQAMKQHLDAGGQVLLFLNRRGYAPVLMCHDCGWMVSCKRCEALYTYHQYPQKQLCCHRCGSVRPVSLYCKSCEKDDALETVGVGTEQLEETLQQLFVNQKIIRIDRSNTQKKGQLEALLEQAHSGEAKILLGTQMLAKGHHFAGVTMVGVLNIDGGLFSSDFRATERMGQLLIQVAGRSGRAEKQGEVYLQTHHPESPLLLTLLKDGYAKFAKDLLLERKDANWPPFSSLATFHAEATDKNMAFEFLQDIKAHVDNWQQDELITLGPVPSLIQKKAGHFRTQLILQSNKRAVLQAALTSLNNYLRSNPNRKVRFTIDVDPQEMG